MKPATVLTAMVAGTTLAGATYLLRQRARPLAPPPNVLTLVTPTIDIQVAENMLQAMEPLDGNEVTIVVHTAGGCVISCVMIAKALQQFRHSTVVVPYMAASGGTLIALSAKTLLMGRNASLSAVDPILGDMRVKHLPVESDDPIIAFAHEVKHAVQEFVDTTLAERMPNATQDERAQASAVFLGEALPHAWPLFRKDVAGLGLEVHRAARVWSTMVDAYRKRWWNEWR